MGRDPGIKNRCCGKCQSLPTFGAGVGGSGASHWVRKSSMPSSLACGCSIFFNNFFLSVSKHDYKIIHLISHGATSTAYHY